MKIKKLKLSNFRNFEDKTLEFAAEATVVVGPNTSGKTNILESIHLLSTGKSFKAEIEEEMIAYGEEIARVKGLFLEGKEKTILEVVLTRGEITIGETPGKTKKVARKRLKVNGVGKRLIDFAGNFKTVLFGPQDLDLVTESPSLRRKFLDSVLSQVDREYRRAVMSYNKALRHRNKLLLKIREEGVPRSQLLFWDKLLIKNGDYVARCREDFINFVNEANLQLPLSDFQLEYDKSAISESRIKQYAKEEVAAATTLVGPHRDDFLFFVKTEKERKRDLSKYGSRGEQRMGVLWLKMAELAFVEQESQETPTLLLDDIFSELDHEHRDIVMELISKERGFAGQVIITTADPHYIEEFGDVEKINLA